MCYHLINARARFVIKKINISPQYLLWGTRDIEEVLVILQVINTYVALSDPGSMHV